MRIALIISLSMLLLFCISGCAKKDVSSYTDYSNEQQNTTMITEESTSSSALDENGGVEYDIASLNGSIRVPKGYYLFGEGVSFTDQMCQDIGVTPDNMRSGLSLLQGQTLIVPSNEPYSDSFHIYIKVKEKKYDDITLSELSLSEFEQLASMVVESFGVSDYEMVEGNGLRFFVFTANLGFGDVCRYATILNGHMVYVYAQAGNKPLTETQKKDLEHIALSIQHAL